MKRRKPSWWMYVYWIYRVSLFFFICSTVLEGLYIFCILRTTRNWLSFKFSNTGWFSQDWLHVGQNVEDKKFLKKAKRNEETVLHIYTYTDTYGRRIWAQETRRCLKSQQIKTSVITCPSSHHHDGLLYRNWCTWAYPC